MLRLAGETTDGALLNWATPERIAVSRTRIDEGAARGAAMPELVAAAPDEMLHAVGYYGPVAAGPALIRSWL